MENRILIFGATGRTGLIATEYAIAQGYSVTVLVRNPEKITIQSPQLRVIKGSPTDLDDVRIAMKDCNYVINLLSALPEKESFSFKKIDAPHVLEKSIKNALQCMREYGIKRILSLSSIGVGDSHKYAPWYMRLIIKITNFSIVFADHHAQEQLLRASDVDWTIARPVALNNDEVPGTLVISYNKKPNPFRMSRKQLAAFFIDNLNTDMYIHQSPILSESAVAR